MLSFIYLFAVLQVATNGANSEYIDDFIESTFQNPLVGSNTDDTNNPRYKRAEATPAVLENRPCFVPSEPATPNFTTPTRRVSEAACYDTVWMIRRAIELDRIFEKCQKYKEEHPEYWGAVHASIHMDDEPAKNPHMVAIGWKARNGTYVYLCSGTLISKLFVLTAAHCTRVSEHHPLAEEAEPQVLRLKDKGLLDVQYKGILTEVTSIKQIYIHPSYKAPGQYYDIALMQSKHRLYSSKLSRPACLWMKEELPPSGQLVGWGVVATAGKTVSPAPLVVDMDILDNEQCNKRLQPLCSSLWCGLQDQFCARAQTGVELNQGLSGGPLHVDMNLPVTKQGRLSYVVGVMSFASPDSIGVFTRVADVIDWIEPIVWDPKFFRDYSRN